MRLLTKASLITLAGVAMTAAAAGYFVFASTQSVLQAQVKAKQKELGRQTMDAIDRLLFGHYIDIQNIGEEEGIERALRDKHANLKSIERRVKELSFLTGPWDALKIIDADGNVIISSTRREADAGPAERNGDDADLEALKQALGGAIFYSDVLISKGTGKPTVIFAAPVRDQEKTERPITGAIVGHAAWPAITELVQQFDPINAFNLYRRDGLLIATNRTPAVLFTKSGPAALVIQKYFLNSPRVHDIEREFESGGETLPTVAHSVGHLAYKGSGWSLFIEAPKAVAYAPATATARNIVLFILPVILSVAALTLFFISRLVIRPITIITGATKVIAEGDLTKRVKSGSKDEIGDLASSFNTMTGKVAGSFDALKLEKEKMETLLESIGDGVMAIEPNGHIMLWNKAAADISGWPKEEALGKHYHDVFRVAQDGDKKDGTGFIDAAAEYKTPQTLTGHSALTRKDGTAIPIGDSASPLLGANGELQGIIVVFRDMAEERKIAKAKDEFVSLASHQLRTPLTAIKWNIEMLLKRRADMPDDRQNKHLHDIKASNERMIELVTALLNVSRIELGGLAIEPRPSDFTLIAADVLNELGPEIEAKRLRVETSYGESLPLINADEGLVRIIMQNLLTNAIEYTPENGTISLRIRERGPSMEIIVADSGCGIPKDEQEKMFTKFFRASNARQIKPSGTGLGLYIVKSVAEAAGGEIRFESEANKGATFTVSLPMAGMSTREGAKILQ